jgi:hypothetical protein
MVERSGITYEHEDALPEGDGVVVPAEAVPGATLGGRITFVHTPTGRTRLGDVVAFDHREGGEWVVIRYR